MSVFTTFTDGKVCFAAWPRIAVDLQAATSAKLMATQWEGRAAIEAVFSQIVLGQIVLDS